MMKFNIFTMCCLLVVSVVSAQKPKDISNYKSFRTNNEFFQFHVKGHDDKLPRNFSTNKTYFWYKSQSVIQTQGGGSGQLLHGQFESYYTNKQLCRRGTFTNGLQHGKWTYWNEKGQLNRIEYFKRGEKVRNTTIFNHNGEVYKVILHKKHCTISQLDSIKTILRNDSSLIKQEKKLSNGAIEVVRQNKNGELHGKQTVKFRKNKGQHTLSQYKNGTLHGKQISESGEIQYYKNGELTDRKPLNLKNWIKRKDKKEDTENKEEQKTKKDKIDKQGSKTEKPTQSKPEKETKKKVTHD